MFSRDVHKHYASEGNDASMQAPTWCVCARVSVCVCVHLFLQYGHCSGQKVKLCHGEVSGCDGARLLRQRDGHGHVGCRGDVASLKVKSTVGKIQNNFNMKKAVKVAHMIIIA